MTTDERSELERTREAARRAREEAIRLRRQARELQRTMGRNQGDTVDTPPPMDSSAVGQDLPLDGIRTVVLHQNAGRLIVLPCPEGASPGVSASTRGKAPTLSIQRQGDTLRIDVRQSISSLFRRRQGATTTIRLAPGLARLQVDLGAGDIQIRDVGCDELRATTGAGVISLASVRAAADLGVGAGRITVYEHTGTVSCESGTGDVTVDVAEAVAGDYQVHVGMGRAELRLPPGCAVFPHARSGIGRGRVEYPDAGEGAPTRVTVESGIGEATIRVRRAGEKEEPSGRNGPPAGKRSPHAARSRQSEEFRILQLLEQNRITAAEAAELIAAVHGTSVPAGGLED